MNRLATKEVRTAFWTCTVLMVLMMFPDVASAQATGASDGGIFCWVARYFKQIVGAAALVAIFMWAIEHIFGASQLHDIVIRVGVGCGIVIAGATMITSSGLVVGCTGI